MSRYLAEPRSILAEPLGSAEPRLKNTALGNYNKAVIFQRVWFNSLQEKQKLESEKMFRNKNKMFKIQKANRQKIMVETYGQTK